MIKDYLGRKFHWRECNCWELCRVVWRDLTGVDLPFDTPELLTVGTIKQVVGRGLQHCLDKSIIVERRGPVEPCLVLFQARTLSPHGGVFINDMVLHVTPFDHVRHEPLDIVMAKGKFTEAKFFSCP